ncbi:MAG: phosphopyruvate hydratase, partial [Candidatus Aenigmarchaeota archaeon]|nr:phosphopyruvate hydratase [Candidatus Aenigmarchaeota archaeon]
MFLQSCGHAREVLDSRGNPAVEVEVNGARTIVPSGVSAGTYEALELRDGGSRYMGKGVQTAVSNVNKVISKKVAGKSFTQAELDGLMVKLDGTRNKSRLGANAILGMSMAFCAAQGDVYETIRNLYGGRYVMPLPFMNVLEGGKHAGNGLSMQEFMVVPSGAKKFSDALRIGSEIYHALREIIMEKYGNNGINVGDEGGFAPPLDNTESALELVSKSIEESGHKVKIALDAAASEFFSDGSYYMDGKSLDAGEM